MVDDTRVRAINQLEAKSGPVVYWMQRDQRVDDNWALLYAQERALEKQTPLYVVFNLVPTFAGASWRQYDFMLHGLEETASRLASLNIFFCILQGDPTMTVPAFATHIAAGEVVTDFNPLRFIRSWKETVAKGISVRMSEVDAHNSIPCWVASDKEEFAAYTFRPKVHRKLSQYLTDFPEVVPHSYGATVTMDEPDFALLRKTVLADRLVAPVDWLIPGAHAGKAKTRHFILNGLTTYSTDRNDPTKNGQSDLSPYLHYGQLSAQWVARQVSKAYDSNKESRDAFLEELIVRRELADNFCYYNQSYNLVIGAHAWAQKTIAEHACDTRDYVYESEEFETGKTHDELWNAMQRQLVKNGKLHGWCRMYWAKKILEWTPTAQVAIDTAIYLNDKYSLDGNDPSGITGIMWSICGT